MNDHGGRTFKVLTLAGCVGACLFSAASFAPLAKAKPATDATAKKQTPPPPAASTPETPPPAPAVDPAFAALQKRDFVQARVLGEEEAARGAPAAHTLLGQIYEYGLGVPKDDVKAAEWYAKGAALGDANSQFCLGALLI